MTASRPIYVLLALLACGCHQSVELSELNDKREFRVGSGDVIVVRLPTNPSTGYRWVWAESPARAVVLDTEPALQRDVRNDTSIGLMNTEVWRFRARASGTLRLEYRRVWESPSIAPAKTFSVELRVK
jgi:inhibitor of cysteine peptidase